LVSRVKTPPPDMLDNNGKYGLRNYKIIYIVLGKNYLYKLNIYLRITADQFSSSGRIANIIIHIISNLDVTYISKKS